MRVSIHDLRALKADGKRFVMLTAYDFPTAQILDRASVPVLLVGDSVGRNVLPPGTSPGHHGRDAPSREGSRAWRRARHGRGRHAVHVLPGERGGRRAQRRPDDQGGWRTRGEGRGRAVRPDQPTRRDRHPGHGPRGAHAAIRLRAGRHEGAGSRRSGDEGPRAGDAVGEGRRVRRRARGDARRTRIGDHALLADPDDRHRRRARVRRPGAYHPRPARDPESRRSSRRRMRTSGTR